MNHVEQMYPSIMKTFCPHKMDFLLKAVLIRDCIPGLGLRVSSSVNLLYFLLSEVWGQLCM